MIHNFDEVYDRTNSDSKKYDKYPPDVIPMWIADSDFKCPQPIIDEILKRAQEGIYGYTTVSKRLKSAVALWMDKRFNYKVGESEVEFIPVVVSGIVMAIRALSREGDKVLLQTPAYPPFSVGIESNGRNMVTNPLVLKDGRYEIDFEDFEMKCKDTRVRTFILCNPQNPTGRCFSKEELIKMGRICIDNHVFILSDEIHMDLVYKPNKHVTFASISEEFASNSVTFVSASKTFNVPGLRTAAFICKNKNVKDIMHEVAVANKLFGENIFGTIGISAAYEKCDYYADEVVEYLSSNIDLVRNKIKDIRGISLIEPESTYLAWLDLRELNLAQDELMDMFIKKAKVGVQSGTEFGSEGEGFVRMNIACPKKTLETALDRIAAVFS